MLIVCYGITKSGSTLAFELIKGMLASAGRPQQRLPDGLVAPAHAINFVDRVDPASLAALVEATADTAIAVKTHADIDVATFVALEEMHKKGDVRVVASYRDPRDIALSLIDAGAHAREKGRKPFSEFTDLASTYARLQRQIDVFQKWGSIRGAIRLDYATVAFAPETAIDILEKGLGIACDRDAAMRHAFDGAFTQKNKAVRNRYTGELTKAQSDEIVRRFSAFVNRVVRHSDESWFTVFRAQYLAASKTPA